MFCRHSLTFCFVHPFTPIRFKFSSISAKLFATSSSRSGYSPNELQRSPIRARAKVLQTVTVLAITPVLAWILHFSSPLIAAPTLGEYPKPQLQSSSSKEYRKLFDEAFAYIYVLFYPREGLQYDRDDWIRLRNSICSSDRPFTSRARVRDLIRETLASLGDPYTTYLSPQEFSEEIKGAGGGAGVGLRLAVNDGLRVVAPLPESAAERAGVTPGDTVLAVNGILASKAHLSSKEATEMTQGKEGTTVELTISPHATRKYGQWWSPFVETSAVSDDTLPRKLRLTRERLFTPPIKTTKIHDVGVIRIHYFSKDITEAVAQSLRSLVAQGVSRIILDVRNCLGGIFQGSLRIAALLMQDCPSCNIVTTIDGNGVFADHLVSTNDSGIWEYKKRLKVAVLVNEGSASASEVLAVGLRGNHRAVLVGTPTYGKGLIQHYFPLSDGSAIRVTIGEYLQPDGKKVNVAGVRPDILCKDFVHSDPSDDKCVTEAVRALSSFWPR